MYILVCLRNSRKQTRIFANKPEYTAENERDLSTGVRSLLSMHALIFAARGCVQKFGRVLFRPSPPPTLPPSPPPPPPPLPFPPPRLARLGDVEGGDVGAALGLGVDKLPHRHRRRRVYVPEPPASTTTTTTTIHHTEASLTRPTATTTTITVAAVSMYLTVAAFQGGRAGVRT